VFGGLESGVLRWERLGKGGICEDRVVGKVEEAGCANLEVKASLALKNVNESLRTGVADVGTTKDVGAVKET
jgi:hypothetical protein